MLRSVPLASWVVALAGLGCSDDGRCRAAWPRAFCGTRLSCFGKPLGAAWPLGARWPRYLRRPLPSPTAPYPTKNPQGCELFV